MTDTAVAAIFAENGALAQTINGYAPRASQLEMAQSIASAIANRHNLVAEAGTGTGKTFAYLIPAILSGKKVIISTGTKNLQDQLFNKDLPIIRKALKKTPFRAGLLKGRANYLCTYRLDLALNTAFGFNKEEARGLAAIKRWAQHTENGDISEVADVRDTDPLWFHATATKDNCLGQDCPDYANCFLAKARRRAQEADIVIVNHYLLCADWSLRESGFGELLPKAEVVIIDEAHQLAEIASNFLGLTFSSNQVLELATDTLAEYFSHAKDMPDLRAACEDLQACVKTLRHAFGIELKRGDWQDIAHSPERMDALAELQSEMDRTLEHLALASVRSKGLETCFNRAEMLAEQLQILLDSESEAWIKWYETHSKSLTLSRTPLNVSEEFQTFMAKHPATWIFTSATLSVANDFSHFTHHLGLWEATTQSWESPFDYQNQALFYHPRGLPQPKDPQFTDKILDFAIPVLKASQGRAFFLFTSHKALQRAAKLLEKRLDYPLLVQGTRSKSKLLEQFIQQQHAVLLATASFWEGVDVRGEALSCVIIDKLPFASPDDPVLKARFAIMEQQGRNPFFEYQVPSAVIALRQGVGRLIRDVDDRGVLMVCDPRLLKRGYGHFFLESLPAMRRTRVLEDVQRFFEHHENRYET